METVKAGDIDEYISTFPLEVQKKLNQLCAAIRQAAPDALEKISYAMPTFWQGRNLVHFAAFKHHIGFYPGAGGVEAFKLEIAKIPLPSLKSFSDQSRLLKPKFCPTMTFDLDWEVI